MVSDPGARVAANLAQEKWNKMSGDEKAYIAANPNAAVLGRQAVSKLNPNVGNYLESLVAPNVVNRNDRMNEIYGSWRGVTPQIYDRIPTYNDEVYDYRGNRARVTPQRALDLYNQGGFNGINPSQLYQMMLMKDAISRGGY